MYRLQYLVFFHLLNWGVSIALFSMYFYKHCVIWFKGMLQRRAWIRALYLITNKPAYWIHIRIHIPTVLSAIPDESIENWMKNFNGYLKVSQNPSPAQLILWYDNLVLCSSQCQWEAFSLWRTLYPGFDVLKRSLWCHRVRFLLWENHRFLDKCYLCLKWVDISTLCIVITRCLSRQTIRVLWP